MYIVHVLKLVLSSFVIENKVEMQGKVTNVHNVSCTSPSRLTGLLHVMYYSCCMTSKLFSSQRGTKLCGNPCPICRDDIKIDYKVS